MAKNLSFKQRLKQIGLSENEANVYLCVLEKGRTTPKEIAEETGLNHTTSYRVLKYLVKKSLVSMAKEGEKKLFFSIEDPDRIRDYLKEKRRELREQEEYLDDLMPSLKTVYKGHRYLKIDFFNGKEGVYWLQKKIAEDAHKTQTYYAISPIDYAQKNFPKRKTDPRNKFLNKRMCVVYTTEGEKIDNEGYRFVSRQNLNSAIELSVVNDKVTIFTLDGEFGGILIQDIKIADFFKQVIELLYKEQET